jgi:predicted aspartyl protease
MHRRSLLAFAALLPFLDGCATAQAITPDQIPLSFDDDGRPVVQVRINGSGPHPFVIDTAAQGTGLSPAFVQSLGLVANGQQGVLQGTGGAQAVSVFTLASVELGSLRRENVIAMPFMTVMEDTLGTAACSAPICLRARGLSLISRSGAFA